MSPERRSRRPEVSTFKYEPGINIEYGKKTWRPVQSVMDIVQNHLDAHTTKYEKNLLRLAGIQDYDPSDKQQQEIISLMNTIKYSKNKKKIEQAFSSLPSTYGEQGIDQLREQLDGISYERPDIRLKLMNGKDTRYLKYGDVKKYSEDWQVVGFRVKDTGSGFDDRLLGMMGASTKQESTGKRGGLGEGLKMSVTDLLRYGSDIQLISRNQDNLWMTRPQIKKGRIVFKGIKIPETEKATVSMTEVDFSKATLDDKSREEITAALDPRKGEGLGKYVLEFRGDDFIPLVDSLNELTSHGVPAGRVYVKGLLVQENQDLLFSYNLGEKWAIQGRDRKTVKENVLLGDIRKAISSISEKERLNPIVSAIAQKGSQLELEIVDSSLDLGKEQAQAWRRALEEVFKFEAGKTLFAPNYLSSDQQRLLKEQGFKVVLIPPERKKAIEFFEKLYDGKIVSSRQFFEQREAQTTSRFDEILMGTTEVLIPFGVVREQDTPVSPESAAQLDGLKNDFMIILLRNVIARNNLLNLNLENLEGLKFAVAKKTNADPNASPFEYNRARNTIYVGDTDLSSFQAQVDLYVEMIKTSVNREVFDTATQAISEQLAAKAVVKLRPEILEQYTPIHLNGNSEFQKPATYTDVERAQDAALTDFLSYLRVINTPDVSQDEVQSALAKIREYDDKQYDPNLAQVKEVLMSFKNEPYSVFYFDGKLYTVSSYGFLIDEIKLKGSATDAPVQEQPENRTTFDINTFDPNSLFYDKFKSLLMEPSSFRIARGESIGESKMPPEELLQAGEDQYSLEAKTNYYLPYQLQDGESMRLTFSGGEKDAYVFIKRRGNKIFTKRGNKETTDIIPLGQSASLTEQYFWQGNTFSVYNNVIKIKPSGNYEVSIERNSPSSTAQLPEENEDKDFISTNITVDYGGEVWRDPKRILLDALQNHVDAQNGEAPNFSFTVVDSSGKITRVSKDELLELGNEWRIVGVSIQDQGEGYTTPYLSSLGASTKGNEDIGGEGLKMLAASAVRQGINVEFSSRNWRAKPTSYESTVKDYETVKDNETGKDKVFTMLGYKMQWADTNQVGSSTEFSVLPSTLEQGQQSLSEAQLSEMQALLDPSSSIGKIWQEWMNVLDPRHTNKYGQRGLDRFIAPKEEEVHTDGIVKVISSQPGMIFEKGLFIPSQSTTQPMMFGYDLDESIIDTRERNAYNEELLDNYLKEYYMNLTDKDLIKRIVETVKANPDINFYEYKFLKYSSDVSPETNVLWR